MRSRFSSERWAPNGRARKDWSCDMIWHVKNEKGLEAVYEKLRSVFADLNLPAKIDPKFYTLAEEDPADWVDYTKVLKQPR